MKTLIAERQVLNAAQSGQKSLRVPPDAIITPSARDRAKERGVELVFEAPAGGASEKKLRTFTISQPAVVYQSDVKPAAKAPQSPAAPSPAAGRPAMPAPHPEAAPAPAAEAGEKAAPEAAAPAPLPSTAGDAPGGGNGLEERAAAITAQVAQRMGLRPSPERVLAAVRRVMEERVKKTLGGT